MTLDGRYFTVSFDNGKLVFETSTINSVAFAASIGASFSPSSSVAVSGAGAYSENVITTEALAYAKTSNLTSAGDVILDADNEASITASVIAASVAASVSGSTGVRSPNSTLPPPA